MLCLTVHQPWAALIMRGLKPAEFHGWKPALAVPFSIGVHSGRALPQRRDLPEVRRLLALAGQAVEGQPDDWQLLDWCAAQPRGFVLGTVSVVGFRPVPAGHPGRRWGSWAWLLADPVGLPEPVRAIGQLGLWDLADRVA